MAYSNQRSITACLHQKSCGSEVRRLHGSHKPVTACSTQGSATKNCRGEAPGDLTWLITKGLRVQIPSLLPRFGAIAQSVEQPVRNRQTAEHNRLAPPNSLQSPERMIVTTIHGSLAHSGERLVCNQEAAGAEPAGSTKNSRAADRSYFSTFHETWCSGAHRRKPEEAVRLGSLLLWSSIALKWVR
jgi:hypothetical protein